jgi:UMF1 family MFS transporter
MGYIGALCLLILSLAGMLIFGLKQPASWGPFFVFAGLWFLLGMTPSVFMLHDDAPTREPSERNIVVQSFGRVADTLRHAGHYRQLMKFLIAFFVYAFGVQVIIGFASIIAADFGFEQEQLILFVAQITITAGLASAGTTTFQDKIGAKRTVMLYLVIWIASCTGLILIKLNWPDGGPQWPLWLVGNGLGFALGGIGTASRSMIGRFTPKHRTAEFFGLWGMTYKLAGAIGVLSFGAVAGYFGQLASLWLLLAFFAVGFVLVLPVSEVAGVRAARRAERDHERLAIALPSD